MYKRQSDSCPEELYDSFIGAKNFTAECNEITVGDPNEPCTEGGLLPEGIIFRVDVPNGKYRFVAAVGSPDNLHAHRIIAEDGGHGPPDKIGPNHVVLVANFQQSQFAVGEVDPQNPGKGVFARVGFDDKIPPPGDYEDEFPSPRFINMDENGLPTSDCANSPVLEVTQGYIRIHQLQGNSNDGCGGPGDPNGGDLVILELWRIIEGPPPGTIKVYVGDTNNDGALNIADAVNVLTYLFGGGSQPPCLKAADVNDDDGVNIADAVAILSYLFSGQAITGPDGKEIPVGGHPGCAEYDKAEVETLGCQVPCQR